MSDETLTGGIDFFTLTTLVEVENTGITKPLDEIKKEMRIPENEEISVKLYGRKYNSDAEYIQALNRQENAMRFIKLIESRAQPVMLNIIDEGKIHNVSFAIPPAGHLENFGTRYANEPGNVFTIKFAIEHEGAWTAYRIAEELNGLPVLGTIPFFDTKNVIYRNTIILKNNFI